SRLSDLAVELIAQNCNKPSTHICPRLIAVLLSPSFHDCVLHQIIGAVSGANERHRKSAQVRQRREKLPLEALICGNSIIFHYFFEALAFCSASSSFSSKSKKRSGIPSSCTAVYNSLSFREITARVVADTTGVSS